MPFYTKPGSKEPTVSIIKDAIMPHNTYKTEGGKLLYVHDVQGQKVTYYQVGSTERAECSLGRFASRIVSIEPNQ